MKAKKLVAAAAVAVASSLMLSACAPAAPAGVTITWWHNATSDPLKGLWETVAKEFQDSHQGVTIKITAYQNEELQRTVIPQALQAGGSGAPSVFMVWPGGEVANQAKAGYLKDLTTPLADDVKKITPLVAKQWQVDGKQYGVPFTFSVEGFWYNKDQFAQAGITTLPKTLPELNAANTQLKALNVAPIAVGAGDGWPAGHWWYQFAIASCSTATLEKAIASHDFEDPCWVSAGQQLKAFVDTNPFQDGWLSSSGQQGADSADGLVANGKASMQLMGGWAAGTIGSLTPDKKVPEWLGWYPMVSIPGSAGTAGIQMGGGDGWGVWKDAPDVAVEFVKYLQSDDVQKRYAEAATALPTNSNAKSAITDKDPRIKSISDGIDSAPYIQLWLDSALGPDFGTPLNNAVVKLMGNQGTPEDIVKVLKDTAAQVK